MEALQWLLLCLAITCIMIEKGTYYFSRFLATKKSLTDVLSRQKNINTVFHLFLGHWPDVGITVREGRNNFPLRSLFGGVPGRYARYMEQVHWPAHCRMYASVPPLSIVLCIHAPGRCPRPHSPRTPTPTPNLTGVLTHQSSPKTSSSFFFFPQVSPHCTHR